MRRFISTATVGALVCAAGAFLDPDKDGPTWLIFPITGFLLSAACLAVVVLPLRSLTCRFVTHSTPRFQACVVAATLIFIVGVLAVCLPSVHISMTRLGFTAFWAAYVVGLGTTFFWPFVRHDHDPAR